MTPPSSPGKSLVLMVSANRARAMRPRRNSSMNCIVSTSFCRYSGSVSNRSRRVGLRLCPSVSNNDLPAMLLCLRGEEFEHQRRLVERRGLSRSGRGEEDDVAGREHFVGRVEGAEIQRLVRYECRTSGRLRGHLDDLVGASTIAAEV